MIKQNDENAKVNLDFRHKTLEERYGEWNGEIYHLEEFDWGPPIGKEFRLGYVAEWEVEG